MRDALMRFFPRGMGVCVPPPCLQYITSKTGLRAFATVVLADVRALGVKVSTLLPGIVNTELGRKPGPVEKTGKAPGGGSQGLMSPQSMVQPQDIADAGLCVCVWRGGVCVRGWLCRPCVFCERMSASVMCHDHPAPCVCVSVCVCAVMYVATSAPNCCPITVTIETMGHNLPALRRHADKYLASVGAPTPISFWSKL